MVRKNKILVFIVTIILSIAFTSCALKNNNAKNESQIISQEQAAKHAANLANEQCQKDFGRSPFKPESYKAEFIDSKWHWGKFDPIGIYGYSAKVEFCKDGSDKNVQVAFSTDKLINTDKLITNESKLNEDSSGTGIIKMRESDRKKFEKIIQDIESDKIK